MKKMLITGTSLLILSLSVVAGAGQRLYTIGILQWNDTQHEIDAVEGFEDGIRLSGIPHRFNIARVRTDEAKARKFLQRCKEKKVDLICAIGTKATILALQETRDIPVVFAAVDNPVISGIADSWASSGRNVTGSSNWINLKRKIAVLKECLPHLKKLGVIYDPDNPVPVAEVTEAKDVCKSMGIEIREATVKKAEDIEEKVKELTQQNIDALWVPIEKLVYQNMIKVGRVTIPRKLPVFSSTLQGIGLSEQEGVENVSLVAMTVDYKALGRLCVPAAVEILTKNKKPYNIPIRTLSNPLIVVNANTSEDIGYKIPPIFLTKASKVISGYEGRKITIAGTGDSEQLLRVLAKSLEEKLKGCKIEVPDSIGSGGGIKALVAGKVDLARVARPLKMNEEKSGLTYKLFAKSPVVFVINPSVTNIDNITTEQIIGIYSGSIINWQELGIQYGKIYPVTRETGDSSLKIINKNISDFEKISTKVAKTIYNTPQTIDALVRHRNTIGFAPMSAVAGTKLRILKVDGIYPSIENVSNGKYRLVVPLGIVYKEEPAGLTRKFIDFLYSDQGQRIIIENGAVPAK
jgi:phosphate transport system substrate-binding protein